MADALLLSKLSSLRWLLNLHEPNVDAHATPHWLPAAQQSAHDLHLVARLAAVHEVVLQDHQDGPRDRAHGVEALHMLFCFVEWH